MRVSSAIAVFLILLYLSCVPREREALQREACALKPGKVAVLPADGHDINVRLADAVRVSLPGETCLYFVTPEDILRAIPWYPDLLVSLDMPDSFSPGDLPPRLSPEQDRFIREVFSYPGIDYVLPVRVGKAHIEPDQNLGFVDHINLELHGYLIDRDGKILSLAGVTASDTVFMFSSTGPVIEAMLDEAAPELLGALTGTRGKTR